MKCRKHSKHCERPMCFEALSVEVIGSVMRINVPQLPALVNYRFYDLLMCMTLPQNTGVETVAISDGTTSYPLIDSNAQPVISGRLSGHRRYLIRFGAGGALSNGSVPAHFTVPYGMCPVKYSSNAAYQALPE